MSTTESSPTLAEVIADASELLGQAGIADAQVDAEMLAAHVCEVGRGQLQAASIRGDRLDPGQARAFAELLSRRAEREPLQHLTGRAPFRHLFLQVGRGVFVPRPETEMVAQLAIDAVIAAATPAPIAVDLGTGSGAIALSIATEVPHARVYAAERSPEAFVWASRNAAELGADNLSLEQSDLATAFPELNGAVSVLVSNPPYVPDEAIPRDPEVRLFDPPAALYGGPDGLDVIRMLSRVGMRLVHPGGVLVIEHGEWQGESVRELLAADGWRAGATHPDLTQRERATTAIRS